MKHHPRIAFLALFLSAGLVVHAAQKKVEVEARGLKLSVPESWARQKPSSKMRVFQFEISGKADQKAELVVYNFGGPTGGIKANVDRWIGQFHEEGRKSSVVKGQSAQGEYVLVNISGTWKKPVGRPFARKTKDTPNSRVLGVILTKTIDGQASHFFFKMGGPDALVAAQAQALRESFGAKAESEKPFKP